MDKKKIHKLEKNKTTTWHMLLKKFKKKRKKFSGLFFLGTARHVWARHEWARTRARVGTARVPGWHGTARHEMNSKHSTALARARVGFL